MFRGRDPVLHGLRMNSSVVIPVWVAAMIASTPFSPAAATPAMSPLSSEANGSLVFHSGCSGAMRLHAIEGKQDLKRHRLLGPERAVVVERGNALGHRHEVRRPSLVTGSTKSTIAFLAPGSFQEGSGSCVRGGASARKTGRARSAGATLARIGNRGFIGDSVAGQGTTAGN